MKLEEACINQFGLHELLNYVFAKKHRHTLQEEFYVLEENFYLDAPVVMTRNNGSILYAGSGMALEDFVIEMVEEKDLMLQRIERLRKQEELFNMAMDSLTPRERDVIQVHYFNRDNDLGLSLEFFQEVLVEAQEKLCSFIGEERAKQRVKVNRERIQQREQLKKDIQSGRVRVV
jgi:hypothetical protein